MNGQASNYECAVEIRDAIFQVRDELRDLNCVITVWHIAAMLGSMQAEPTLEAVEQAAQNVELMVDQVRKIRNR